MEFEKVFSKDGAKDNECKEVHETWYNQRFRFTITVYANGDRWLSIWDYHRDEVVVERDLPGVKS